MLRECVRPRFGMVMVVPPIPGTGALSASLLTYGVIYARISAVCTPEDGSRRVIMKCGS